MRPRPRKFSLGIFVAASILVPAGLFLIYAAQGYRAALSNVEDRMARRAAMLSEHAARVFDGTTVVIDMVESYLKNPAPPFATPVTTFLQEYVARNTAISAIILLDRQGQAITSSRGPSGPLLDNSDREYFQRAKAGPQLVVGAQFKGKVSGKQVFSLSRRIASGDVVAVTVRADYFEQIFSNMLGQEEPAGVVALYRHDGSQLVRYPNLGSPANLASDDLGLMRHMGEGAGFFRAVPRGARTERLFAFNRVAGYPVYVTYGIDVHKALTPWITSLGESGLLAALAAGLLTSFALFASHRLAQADRTEAALQQAIAERTQESLNAIEQREFALRAAETAHHAKANFLAAASHDLRQPIQALRLFLDVLEGRLREPADQSVLDHASRALRGAEDLLAALLDVSTLDAGMVAPDLQAVKLRAVLDDLAGEFETQAQAKGVRFRYVPNSSSVITDPVLLSRLLRNLLVNALRYTRQGTVLLGCRLENGFVRVEIWDTGVGIPADKLEHVFEDFVQLGNPERDRTKGLGLGLAVVRRMAGLMGHEVGIRSWEGRGSVFSVTLADCPQPTETERYLLPA